MAFLRALSSTLLSSYSINSMRYFVSPSLYISLACVLTICKHIKKDAWDVSCNSDSLALKCPTRSSNSVLPNLGLRIPMPSNYSSLAFSMTGNKFSIHSVSRNKIWLLSLASCPFIPLMLLLKCINITPTLPFSPFPLV